jgi:hypothetical protein
MAETARSHDHEPADGAVPKPSLQLVRATPTGPELEPEASAPEASAPDVGRTAAIGYLAGFVVVTIAITVAGTLAGHGFTPSLGLGAFVGMWGGGGFGLMVGGTLPLARHLDEQANHPRR